MASSSRSRRSSTDIALRRLRSLTSEEVDTAAPTSPSDSVPPEADGPPNDVPLCTDIPVPPYAAASTDTATSPDSPGSAADQDTGADPTAERNGRTGRHRRSADGARPRTDRPPGENDAGGRPPDTAPDDRPPRGYVEVDGSPPPRSRLSALAELLPSGWAEQPLLNRGSLQALLVVCACAILATAWFLLQSRPDATPAPELISDHGLAPSPSGTAPAAPSSAPAASPTGEVIVHVGGKVETPGVYSLPAGSRVADAIEAAGGVSADADVDTDTLNLARPLVDGERVLVGVTPSPGAPGPTGAAPRAGMPGVPSGPGAVDAPGPLDLNTATSEQLQTLPGIGPVLAERIVRFRDTNGGFGSVKQLREVSGIGERRFADLRERVWVSAR
ncbi:hypothetical protein GCM10009799_39410 [Nocardiopsis rhodophaea]|uniref:Helix-hairpin-helix DNA-binding motif class 1 domain-containing protein n=2 Tax=Nocardiopsis rhodophaea TaxID=280238 RepID=A0ABP5EWN5_9ACTN